MTYFHQFNASELLSDFHTPEHNKLAAALEMLAVHSDYSNVPLFMRHTTNAAASLAWGIVNRVRYNLYIPLHSFTINRITWGMGSVQAGNYDIGFYDANGVAIWRKGLTAVPAINTAIDETGMSIPVVAGQNYYTAWWSDSATVAPRQTGVTFSNWLLDIDNKSWTAIYTAGATGLDATLPLLYPNLSGAGNIVLMTFKQV